MGMGGTPDFLEHSRTLHREVEATQIQNMRKALFQRVWLILALYSENLLSEIFMGAFLF